MKVCPRMLNSHNNTEVPVLDPFLISVSTLYVYATVQLGFVARNMFEILMYELLDDIPSCTPRLTVIINWFCYIL